MPRPKLLIIVLFQNLGEERAYYARSPSPPLSGLLLAGLTPPIVEVEVLHEMVRPIDYDTDAEFIALSFMDFCAPHAYEVARRFRERGKLVVAGGRYPSTFPAAVAPHFDAVVVVSLPVQAAATSRTATMSAVLAGAIGDPLGVVSSNLDLGLDQVHPVGA